MKKKFIGLAGILLALTAFGALAGGGRPGMGGGPHGNGQNMQQRQGGSGDMRQERARIHQQQPAGQYRQGDMQQRREMRQERMHQKTPAGGPNR